MIDLPKKQLFHRMMKKLTEQSTNQISTDQSSVIKLFFLVSFMKI